MPSGHLPDWIGLGVLAAAVPRDAIEEALAGRVQAHNDRVTYSSAAAHNSSPTVRDHYRP
ncbi:hypothetical protein ACFVU4_04030 [Streptomyces sp. NPDC058107]|uniref:hypothetical protein n=1 Tax=Streptomyces sp. NPDC058107 TaxID=3346343 RepID=UPI0036EEC4F4